ncbi:hypothetical protein AKO1_009365 [Acrasis kona]|uniref:RPGR-interacting protein 1 first C2 domain-containing protein n=1 Tax=Acrasis kona TaxID=1008807 RepID=A0AAW2ZL43_9EUKA
MASKRVFYTDEQYHARPPNANDHVSILQQQLFDTQKKHQQDDMELMSLQREIREKNKEYRTIQLKYDQLKNAFQQVKENQATILSHLEDLKNEIEEERSKNVELSDQLQLAQVENAKIHDAKIKNEEQQKEIVLLKEVKKSLEKALMDDKKSSDSRTVKKYEQQIEILNEEIRKWNETSKKQYSENKQVSTKLQVANTRIEALIKENNDTKSQSLLHEERVRKLEKQIEMSNLMMESVKKKKELKHTTDQFTQTDRVIEKVKEQQAPPPRQEVERKIVPKPSTAATVEKKLEPKSKFALKSDVHFLQDKNICEVTIDTLVLKSDFVSQNNLAPLFFSVDFFEHDTQATIIVEPNLNHNNFSSAPSIRFGNALRFEVVMNEMFLYYLQNGELLLELNVTRGQDFDVVGRSSIPLTDLVTQEQPIKAFAVVVSSKNENVVIGTVNYLISMDVPILKCVKQDKSALNKFLKLLSANHKKNDDVEVHQTVIRLLFCNQVPTKKSGSTVSVHYKFYTFSTYKTKFVHLGEHGDAKINDEQVFPVDNDFEFKQYLRKSNLDVLLVDQSSNILGEACIPLRDLLSTNAVIGVYKLSSGGEIKIEIEKSK